MSWQICALTKREMIIDIITVLTIMNEDVMYFSLNWRTGIWSLVIKKQCDRGAANGVNYLESTLRINILSPGWLIIL